MKVGGYSLAHLPARTVVSAHARLTRFRVAAQQRFPRWFGLPTLGPYVQLYCENAFFKTQISIFNYYSTFYPECDVRLEYQVTAFDRNGRKLGTGKFFLDPGESLQQDLSQIVPCRLDEYGLFNVMAAPEIRRASCRERVCQYV